MTDHHSFTDLQLADLLKEDDEAAFTEIYSRYAESLTFSVKKIDITIKKNFFKDRLSSSIELQDPFHLYKPQYKINTPEFRRNVLRNSLDWARNFGIHFTYNFSSGKNKATKKMSMLQEMKQGDVCKAGIFYFDFNSKSP